MYMTSYTPVLPVPVKVSSSDDGKTKGLQLRHQGELNHYITAVMMV